MEAADAVLLVTEWNEFMEADWEDHIPFNS